MQTSNAFTVQSAYKKLIGTIKSLPYSQSSLQMYSEKVPW